MRYRDIEKAFRGRKAGKTALILAALCLTAAGVAGLALRRTGAGPVRQDLRVMGTDASLMVAGAPRKAARRMIEAAADRLRRVERAMSPHHPGSDVERLNRLGARRPVQLAPATLRVLREAVRFSRLTGGAFDVTYAPLRSLWLEAQKRGASPTQGDIEAALRAVGSEKLIFQGRTVRFGVEGMNVDLGGIAKGFGIDEAAEAMTRHGARSALVNVGGDLRLIGRREDGQKWKILIQDPGRSASPAPARAPVYLRLADVAVATSGDYARFYRIGEQRLSHIIDPRTGRPVRDVPSVTVVAPDAMTADALATAVSVLGAPKGIELVNSLQGAECMAMVLGEDGATAVSYSNGFLALTERGR